MAKAKKAIPDGYRTVTPSLTLDDAKQAIAWYQKGLGAEELMRSEGPDGKIMHAALRIGDSIIMLNDPVMAGHKGPKALGGSPASIFLYVEDCDALFNRAVAAGAKVEMPMADQFWGDRFGSIVDPHGYSWAIATHLEDLTKEEIESRQAEWLKQFDGKMPPK